jgi:hypothetical protein
MASANLSWSPGGGPYSNSQDIFYSELGDSGWILHSTVSASTASAAIEGLLDNVIYRFQVVNRCAFGNGAPSELGEGVHITCPTVDVDAGVEEVDFSFSHLGWDIDSYVVELLDAVNNVLDSISIASPSGVISGSFTGLDPATPYKLSVAPAATGDLDEYSYVCGPYDFTTAVPVCEAPVGVSVGMS